MSFESTAHQRFFAGAHSREREATIEASVCEPRPGLRKVVKREVAKREYPSGFTLARYGAPTLLHCSADEQSPSP